MHRLLRALGRRGAAFRRSRDGNVAIIFAIAIIPIVGLAGGAIDYNRASSVKAAMQAALDATSLAMAKQADSLSASALDRKSRKYFAAAFNRPEARRIRISATYSTNPVPTVTVTGRGLIDTTFLGIFGIDRIPIQAMARTVWGSTRLRLALVLDNTGSMKEDGKIDILKKATQELLKTLKSSSQRAGDIEVAIIPFANGVNVGTGNASASWVDWSYYAQSGGSGYKDNYYRDDWSGGACQWSTCWQSTGTWSKDDTTTNKSSWQGCVMDRDQSYDVSNATPTSSNPSTMFPALYETNCPTSIMPLSYDWSALNDKVNAMVATGSTNQTIGLVWGWHALSPGAPLNATTPPPNTEQAIVLLTDGKNTENRWTTNGPKIDDRMEKVCDNVKSAGITVYTILVMSGNSNLLKQCASDTSKYFALTTPEQMITAFKTIASNLTKLRLAR